MSNTPVNKETAIAVSIVIVVIVGLVVAVKFGSGILEALGLKDDKDEKADDKRIAGAENNRAFKPGYVNPKDEKLGGQKAYDLAMQIKSSVGTVADKPEIMLGAMKSIKNKTQLSQVANVFQVHFKQDLFGWLKDKMDTKGQKDMLSQALKHVDSLR